MPLSPLPAPSITPMSHQPSTPPLNPTHSHPRHSTPHSQPCSPPNSPPTTRYLIQNLTGSNIWYWVPAFDEEDTQQQAQHGAGGGRGRLATRKVFLAAHRSEELKVRGGKG